MRSSLMSAKESRLFLLKKVYRARHPETWRGICESLPTVDELPQADTADLVQAYQYQRTIDADFEAQ